jgi:hypothetical protein
MIRSSGIGLFATAMPRSRSDDAWIELHGVPDISATPSFAHEDHALQVVAALPLAVCAGREIISNIKRRRTLRVASANSRLCANAQWHRCRMATSVRQLGWKRTEACGPPKV